MTETEQARPQVLVVGAGPAGLAAAVAARRRGASVMLVDSADQLGGQFWRHLPPERPSRREARLHHGWARFQQLSTEVNDDPGCRVLTSAQVWALEPAADDEPWAATVHVLVGPADSRRREPLTIRPDALVIATGAYDRTLPFPGWDLPGVFTAGAAQALAKGERVAVGERVLVAGAGPFLLPVAESLTRAGSRVLGVLEANRLGNLVRGWSHKPWQLLRAARKGGELASYATGQLRHRIPYRMGEAVIEAHGTDRVTAVTVARVDAEWRPVAGTERRVEVDAVCVSHGFTPRLELPIAAGCAIGSDRFVVVDEDQRTSVRGVFVAGELTSIGGADLALAEGTIAGHAAAGGAVVGSADVAAAVRERRVFRRFALRLEAAHGIRRGWTSWLRDDTTVCRCEEVTAGALRRTGVATPDAGLRSIKLTSRAGLGICQGRVCGRTVEELLASGFAGAPRNDPTTSDRRPIFSPITIGELAQGATGDAD
ncbi:NAD(P)/FAD-dependent oxidoreductase [Compostimonas suwonensis]|uniref:Thioredoxin reductase n=1 Tax=Compostimonas suwonensis TaxID=1048394 RepID=A0A2M9C573_9MICO|nr:FAD/NAD(P)-binding oxidoreductase [Compostimonas suwonensis]PJJ65680.1 thioredoxin reductase [Compostimonas suwonensis]